MQHVHQTELFLSDMIAPCAVAAALLTASNLKLPPLVV
jgi:hypothetical protein